MIRTFAHADVEEFARYAKAPEALFEDFAAFAANTFASASAPVPADSTAKPAGRIQLGSLLADVGRRAGLADEDQAVFEQRDKTPAEPVRFE